MTRTVVVTVVFPQTFTIEVDDELEIEEQQAIILDHAGYLMETSQSNPVITECSDDNLAQ
jgi:hypothetical protein